MDEILRAEEGAVWNDVVDHRGDMRALDSDDSRYMIETVCGLILECRTRRHPLPAIRDSYLSNKELFLTSNVNSAQESVSGSTRCLQLANALVEMKRVTGQEIRRFNVDDVTLEFNTTEDCRCVQSHYDI